METIDDYIIETVEKDILEPKKGLFKWFLRLFKSDKKIGELNGHWAALFKIILFMLLVSIPTFFTWMVWVTNSIYASQYHISDTEKFEQRITELEKTDMTRADLASKIDRLTGRLDTSSPDELKRRVELLEQSFTNLTTKTVELDKNNVADHSKIITTLDLILKELKK